MHATLPLLKQTDFPPLYRAALDTLQVNLGLSLQPGLPALPRQREPRPQGDDGARNGRAGARRPARPPARHARPHRRRAGAESAFPSPRPRGARARGPGHRPLQSHHPERARLTRTWPNSSPPRASRSPRRCPAIRRRTSTGSAATHVFESSILGLRKLNALGYGRQGTGAGPQPRLQPAGAVAAAGAGAARGDVQARARRALRHRVQSAVHARQHADRALRLDAGLAGQVRAATWRCCARRTTRTISTA